MKKFIENNKKVLIIILIILAIIVVSIVLINKSKKSNIIIVDNENYSFSYDKSWKAIKLEENEIELVHKKSESKFKVSIQELDDEMQYISLDELFDKVLYNIQMQNPDYKLLYREKTVLTKNEIDGYKTLFETNQNQVEICLIKYGKRITLISFEASNEYFDMLLNSVNSIINSFTLNEKKFDVISSIDLETKEIEYSKQDNITNMLEDQVQYEIANKNYIVKFKIPGNFYTNGGLDTKSGYYYFSDAPDDMKITIMANVLNRNIYECLDKNSNTSVYSSGDDEKVVYKYSDSPLTYIYRNESTIDLIGGTKKSEEIKIIFELNKNHVFLVEITSMGGGIPEELVKRIELVEYSNYASNIQREIEDGYLIGILKKYYDYKHNSIDEIKLKIPEEYKELDKENNKYEKRIYVYNLDEEKGIYEYEVTYELSSLSSIENKLDLLKSDIYLNYGPYEEISSIGEQTINDKTFNLYTRGYTRQSDTKDENGSYYLYYSNQIILFYKLKNDDYLTIIISANKGEVTDDLINKLTNFDENITGI